MRNISYTNSAANDSFDKLIPAWPRPNYHRKFVERNVYVG